MYTQLQRTLGALLVVCSVAINDGYCQKSYLNLFLYEKNYIAFKSSPSEISTPQFYFDEDASFAETQSVIHLPLWRKVDEEALFGGNTKGLKSNLMFITQLRYRAFDVTRIPIRSISFMPAFGLQLIKSMGPPATDPAEGMRYFGGINLLMGHHSNAGDECPFLQMVWVGNRDECQVVSESLPENALIVRTMGGNFSTNYWEIGLNGRIGKVETSLLRHWDWALDVGLAFQQHHSKGFPVPGESLEAFRDLYGTSRVRLDINGHKMAFDKWVVFRYWATYELFNTKTDRYPGAKDYRFESTLWVQGGKWPHKGIGQVLSKLALGVRYSRGQDYYNIQYIRNANLLQFVISINTWGPWDMSEK